jgi:energy coupling factor transporter S component ThiW
MKLLTKMNLKADEVRNEHQSTTFISQNQISLKIATTAILSAVGVVLSYLNPFGYISIFGAKINPFAHLINVVSGILLGPFYAVLTALIIATIRYSVGIGSILAFPGGMSGALTVGLARNLILKKFPKKIKFSAFAEPIGTVFIGATISSFIIPVPMMTFWWLFALSCIPGALLGWLIIISLEKAGYIDYFYNSQVEKT